MLIVDRRSLVVRGGLTALAMGFAARMAFAAAPTDNASPFIQRGAADGLHAIASVDDPDLASVLGQHAPDFASTPSFELCPGIVLLRPAKLVTSAILGHRTQSMVG